MKLNNFGKIDVLINNAGAAINPNIDVKNMMDLENLDYLYRVNFRSPVALSLLALPHLKQTNGNILNVTSVGAVSVSTKGYMYYCSLKAALDHWTHGLAYMGAPNVRANSLMPGPIDTPLFEKTDKSVLEHLASTTLMKRFGKSSEMATAMKFICSDDASYVTGTTLAADGGMAMHRH